MHGISAVVLVVAVVAVAYGTQAPSLGVAEFAPAARQAVEPPPTTAADAGASGGPAGRRATTTTTAATSPDPAVTATTSAAPTTRVGRARPCFGDPPRQIEDPLAPPCIATIFDGDNGGSTSKGVSSTEIRVGVPISTGFATRSSYVPTINALFDYVNSRFELYGRRLVPVPVVGDAGTSVAARAHAADLAAQNLFGAITAVQDWGFPKEALPQTLASHGIVTVVENLGTWWSDRTLFDSLHPYAWSVYPSAEDLQLNLGEMACAVLAGDAATYAGSAALRSTTRRFAIVAVGQQVSPSTRGLAEVLTACTGRAPLEVGVATASGGAALQTAMSSLLAGGATTVICVCEGLEGFNAVPGAANQAGFFPEWIFTPTLWGGFNDDEVVVQSKVRDSGMAPPLRLNGGPRLLPIQARPWFQALLAVDPTLATTTPASYNSAWDIAGLVYDQLLVLASGIQAAGPNLTPETFATGLMDLRFPNPGAGQAPYWQPSAGFGPGDHSFFDDYMVGWWSPAADALNGGMNGTAAKGSWCYVDLGARFSPGTYPRRAREQLFNPSQPCR